MRKQLHQPFELQVSDHKCWKERPLIHHFFEIVQILEGEGERVVNQNVFPYRKGSIFLFTPLDCRGFESKAATTFCSIRFSEVFLGECRSHQERERISQWLKQLEHIFWHHNRFNEFVIKAEADAAIVSNLINSMVEEYQQKQAYHKENLRHMVSLVLNILARNVPSSPNAEHGSLEEPLINKILLHIHQNIASPENLRIEYLASRFHISANYTGEYFKKLTGESLQQYINQYRLNLVQQRLAHSDRTLGQIALELGFSDESHLSRHFKKQHGISPIKYRKSLNVA